MRRPQVDVSATLFHSWKPSKQDDNRGLTSSPDVGQGQEAGAERDRGQLRGRRCENVNVAHERNVSFAHLKKS